jgi:hypothetical protein
MDHSEEINAVVRHDRINSDSANKQMMEKKDSWDSLDISVKSLPTQLGKSTSHGSMIFNTPLKDEWIAPAPSGLTRIPLRRSRSSNDSSTFFASVARQRSADTESSNVDSSTGHLMDDNTDSNFIPQWGLRQRKGSSKRRATIGHKRRGSNDDGLVTTSRRRDPISRPRARWLVPVEHPFKVLWDILTVIFSFANAYATHSAIRDRKFGASMFMTFCDTWFLIDILLNFITERKTADGEILRDYKSICARYLTSWFAVDALSLFPWELLYVQPVIELQKRRGFFRKYFFRSRAVVRVTSALRGRHLRWFGQVARHTKHHGIGTKRLLRLLIKYIPKYLLFFRNMKGVVAVRILRQVNWFRRFWRNVVMEQQKDDGDTVSLTHDDELDIAEDDDVSSKMSMEDSDSSGRQVQVVYYENWEFVDDDVPF